MEVIDNENVCVFLLVAIAGSLVAQDLLPELAAAVTKEREAVATGALEIGNGYCSGQIDFDDVEVTFK